MGVAVLAAALGLAASVLGSTGATAAVRARALTTTSTTNTVDTSLPSIKHVFVIVLENESAATTFPSSGAAPSPYLADTMVSEGAFLPNYYGVGHNSNDNYISMISGQAPNTQNSEDCVLFDNFLSTGTTAPYDQQDGTGCVYPAAIPNIASQLDGAGLSWKSYNEDMGNDASRESSTCGHPTVGSLDTTQDEENGDAYATRHDPFVYFHNIIDNTSLCASHVVNLNQLSTDLQSASTTPNYVFITPNLCHDGHDATCDTPGENGGFSGINDFLSKWVPLITNSPAYKDQNGLLITTFDEAATSDTSSCCGEIPGPGETEPGINGPGGGRVGAVLMSPCIAPGTVSDVNYNHYSMLGSVENLFGLGKLGYAQLPGQSYFGSDVYTGACSGSSSSSSSGSSSGSPGSTTSASGTSTSASGGSTSGSGGSTSGSGSGSGGTFTGTVTSSVSSATPPSVRLASSTVRVTGSGAGVRIALALGSSQTGVSYLLQARQLSGAHPGPWRTLESGASTAHVTFVGHSAATYEFRARATNARGRTSAYRTRTVVIPTYAKAAGAVLGGHWRYTAIPGAWRGHAELGATHATYRYSYTGATLRLLATKLPAGGRVRVTLDGRTRVISVHAGTRRPFQIVFTGVRRQGRHRLTLTVLSGQLAVEGLLVSDLG